jgi:hypothetical protein
MKRSNDERIVSVLFAYSPFVWGSQRSALDLCHDDSAAKAWSLRMRQDTVVEIVQRVTGRNLAGLAVCEPRRKKVRLKTEISRSWLGRIVTPWPARRW